MPPLPPPTMARNPPGTVSSILYANPGDQLVFARSALDFEGTCYGFAPDGEIAGIILNNAGGDVIHASYGPTTFDTVDYTTWTVSAGSSWWCEPIAIRCRCIQECREEFWTSIGTRSFST